MKVLIACEESQRVTIEMRALGIECYSCDLEEPSGNHPEWHIHGDVLPYINGNCTFTTMNGTKHTIEGKWDLLIAHPPCTYLTCSGNRWFNVEKYGEKALKRIADREEAVSFFMAFTNANCDHIAIENPIGYMNTHYRKPDQIIQPFQFGEHARKSTCLWLKNLPKLTPTNIVDPGEIINGMSVNAGAYYVTDDEGKALRYNDPRTSKFRSKTYIGIAKAFAQQWGKLLFDNSNKI